MYQFFCDRELAAGQEYQLDEDQAHHARVLRLDREKVRIVAAGQGWYGTIRRDGQNYRVAIEEYDPEPRELPEEVILAVSLIKRDKFELILQKAAELGVTRIIPFLSERTVVRPETKKADRMTERWQTILEEAAGQCKRDQIPVLDEICTLKEVLQVPASSRYFGYENGYEKSPMLGEAIGAGSQLVLIGPEGGLSEKECEKLAENGFRMVSFGRRILRAETAAFYALSVIADRLERRE